MEERRKKKKEKRKKKKENEIRHFQNYKFHKVPQIKKNKSEKR
jgi:hypothetical protein